MNLTLRKVLHRFHIRTNENHRTAPVAQTRIPDPDVQSHFAGSAFGLQDWKGNIALNKAEDEDVSHGTWQNIQDVF